MKQLQGIRVLDLSRILAGPWCTQNLADLGAEVIKVERPGSGDDTRGWGPPYWRDGSGEASSLSAYFTAANRGKLSIDVDFTTPEGSALLQRLVLVCDVVVENYKVGALTKYGLDYPALSALKPDLVYCSVTGFGQTGPWASRPGYDYVAQGLSGLMSITGEPDGMPGAGPQKVGVAVTDLMTGMYAALAIVAALRRRDHTGEGECIDVSLLDTGVAMLANVASGYFADGKVPTRLGNAHSTIVPYQVFSTADGHLIVAVGNDQQFTRLAELLGVLELAHDQRFSTNESRVRNRLQLIPLLQQCLLRQTTSAWAQAMDLEAIPCSPINDLDAVFDSPQILARRARTRIAARSAGVDGVDVVANPIRYLRQPITYEAGIPGLGADTDSVLEELLVLSEEDLAQLRSRGAIGQKV